MSIDYQSDLHEALHLLSIAMNKGEYGVGNEVLERYEKLKSKYEVEPKPQRDSDTILAYDLNTGTERPHNLSSGT